MRKQPTKKKQGIYQIHGLNGCSNIIGEKSLKIICIDIMSGGNAEKKKWVNNLAKTKKHPINRMGKDQFLKKYSGKRTQGIVISFQGEIIQSLPSFKMSKKNKKIALRSVLTERTQNQNLSVLDDLSLGEPKTKEALKLLKDFGLPKRTLFLILDKNPNLELAVRNLPRTNVLRVEGLNVFDILMHEKIVCTQDALKKIEERLS